MSFKENIVEAIIGALVLAVAGLFISYAYAHTQRGVGRGYPLVAVFPSAQGLNVGSDVRISGVKVGTITRQELDPKTFQAKVTFDIANTIKLPTDTSAKIASESLLGGSFIALAPGGDDETLQPGAQIEQVQGAVDLMGLISQAVFSAGAKSSKSASPPQPSQ